MVYQALMTVASFEIVKKLPRDSYALVIGIYTWVGLGIQTILTTIVNTQLELDPRTQFVVYAVFFLFPAGLFTLFVVAKLLRPRKMRHNHDV